MLTAACAIGVFAATGAHEPAAKASPQTDKHILDLINELPPGSLLRRELLIGARGDGVHFTWMDDMRHEGIKRAVVRLYIQFDRRGKPKQMKVAHTEFFEQYENGERVSSIEHLKSIRDRGLEQHLTAIALEKAKHGYWIDIPRPRPHPFIGAATVKFFDDEWLPVPRSPLYCTGDNCLETIH